MCKKKVYKIRMDTNQIDEAFSRSLKTGQAVEYTIKKFGVNLERPMDHILCIKFMKHGKNTYRVFEKFITAFEDFFSLYVTI